jgi:hypothetical protein
LEAVSAGTRTAFGCTNVRQQFKQFSSITSSEYNKLYNWMTGPRTPGARSSSYTLPGVTFKFTFSIHDCDECQAVQNNELYRNDVSQDLFANFFVIITSFAISARHNPAHDSVHSTYLRALYVHYMEWNEHGTT